MAENALRVLDGGRVPRGWDALWERDTWVQDELPHGDLASTYRGLVRINFAGITQPWLKDAAKRWARMRLLGDATPRTISSYMTDLSHFSRWLAEQVPEVTAPRLLTREVLEDFLLWLRTESGWKAATQMRRAVALRGLLEEQAEDGLAGLPRGARIHGSEVPRVNYRLPKEMESGVFAQWVDPRNLKVLDVERDRTIALLLAYTGFRVSSIVTLPRDTLHYGPDGHPYMRYWNIKSKREAMLPIPPVLADQLKRQEQWLGEQYPDGTRWLLPSPPLHEKNGKGGEFHYTHGSLRRVVKAYVRKAGIRTESGALALDVFPHLFRHHLASSLVNDNVPLPVIQKVLDHGSLEMTGHYARVHDETVKRAVMQWHERVNARGERIALPADGPLEEAAWMKERIAWAKQALPNGYCGLPLVQTCPHPNACLSCDNFLTDGSFRQMHVQHRDETRRLLAAAQENQNVRLVEVLTRDDQALTRILAALDAVADDYAPPQLDLFDLAASEDAA